MSPVFLLTEQVFSECGEGQMITLNGPHNGPMLLTLGITRILQQESLEVAVLGSADGKSWRRVAAFPHKSYCGTYSLQLDPSRHRELTYLKASWAMDRWGMGEGDPIFAFYLFAEDAKSRVAGAA